MPRKTRLQGDLSMSALGASMRPRPDAAENVRLMRTVPRGVQEASMRPRPDAAENGEAPVVGDHRRGPLQ